MTERVPAEVSLRLAAVRDAYRLALTDALRSADDPLEAQAVATRLLGDHLGASRVMYGEADPGSAETFTIHREYRRDPAMPTALGDTAGTTSAPTSRPSCVPGGRWSSTR